MSKKPIKRLTSYLLLVLALLITEELVISHIEWGGMNHFAAQMHRMADALLLALPILLCPSRWLSTPWLLIVNIYYLANLWYYRNFGNFIPFVQLFRFQDLNGLGNSIIDSIWKRDILIPIPSVLWLLFCSKTQSFKKRHTGWITLLISIAFILMETVPSFIHKETSYESHPKKMFSEKFSKAYKKYGLINYWIVQFSSLERVSEEDIALVDNWMNERNRQSFNVINPNDEKKNLVIIVVESLSSWQLNLDIEGLPVTPILNSLINDTNVIYFPNCLNQTKTGRSSDAHLMLETGLLPMANNTASLAAASNRYYSLPKALKERYGMESNVFVVDDKTTWWKQALNYSSYGYQEVYDHLTDSFALCMDHVLFSRALNFMKTQHQPFYVKCVTLATHDSKPFLEEDRHVALENAHFATDEIKWHLCRTHYTDSCIGNFLDSLKTNNLYDNSIIVIFGDHHKIGLNDWEGRGGWSISDTYIPFIIINSPVKPNDCSKVIGQIDIYPTLLDLMGVGNYVWRGLGTSLFNPNHPGIAVHHSLDAVGDTENKEEVDRQRGLYQISDIILRSNYFHKRPLQE